MKDHATDFVENPVSAVQNATQNVVNQAQNITAPVVNQVSETLNQSQENHSDQEFVQNPINKIDQIAGA